MWRDKTRESARQFSDSGPLDIAFAKFRASTRQWSSQQIPVYQKKTAAIKALRLNCRDENGLALATKDDAAEMRWCEISGSILNLEFCATRWPETQWN